MFLKILCAQDFNRGSALVQASIIIPLIVLIIVGMISLGNDLCEKVETSSAEHCAAVEDIIDGGTIPPESVIRGKWYFK